MTAAHRAELALDEPERAELIRLRAECAALDDQVKVLVRTEQRLYRSQNALDLEIRRIRTISEFALAADDASPEQALERMIAVLHECFTLDEVVVVDARGTTGPPLPDDVRAWLSTLTCVTTSAERRVADEAALLAALGLPTAGTCTLIPVGVGRVVVTLVRVRKRPVYSHDPFVDQYLPLVQLIGSHVRRVLERADVNGRLADSVRRLERTQAELIQAGKMEAIGRLAGGVAHDFNNLLTVILTHASLAADSLPDGAPQTEDLDRLLEAGERAAQITQQLLALGRKTVQKRDHLDLGQVARDLGRVLQTLLGRSVVMQVEAEQRHVVFADRTQIEQVIMNLVINARDAMPAGGTVRVVVRSAQLADLVAGGAINVAPDQLVVLEVIDSGTGMDEDTRARIFDPFFTTKELGHGTGLGLAVVYGVIKQTEGFIRVDTQLGRGSRFIVLLPRSAGPLTRIRQTAPPNMVGARLLVVEDNAQIRRVACRILTRAGYRVSEASDGVEALEIVGAAPRPFDLVLTDLNMPRMGGFELIRELERTRPNLPILFVTGFSDDLDEISRRAPNVECVTKPFTPDQLLAHVSKRLSGALKER